MVATWGGTPKAALYTVSFYHRQYRDKRFSRPLLASTRSRPEFSVSRVDVARAIGLHGAAGFEPALRPVVFDGADTVTTDLSGKLLRASYRSNIVVRGVDAANQTIYWAESDVIDYRIERKEELKLISPAIK